MTTSITPKQIKTLERKHLILFANQASRELANEIARHLNIECNSIDIHNFANNKIYARFNKSVRGTNAFIIQTHSASINKRIIKQLIMIDALKRASAKRISTMIPYYSYSRQNKKGHGREPITTKLITNMLHMARANQIITINLHSNQIQKFFDSPINHLTTLPLLADHIKSNYSDQRNLIIITPNTNRIKTTEKMTSVLGTPLTFLHKRRNREKAHKIEVRKIINKVDNLQCVLINNMIDTTNTIIQDAKILMTNGAARVTTTTTHKIFSNPTLDQLKNAPITKIVVTNTLPLPLNRQLDKIVILSIANIMADAIRAIFKNASVSKIFSDQNQF